VSIHGKAFEFQPDPVARPRAGTDGDEERADA
jgi:hypothetical protein